MRRVTHNIVGDHIGDHHVRSSHTDTRRSSRGKMDRTRRTRSSLKTLVCLMMIMVICFTSGNFFSSAHDGTQTEHEDSPHKYYKSIQIEHGDSIWSIAETYADARYSTVKEYADELIILNNLDKDDPDYIYEGDYLTVAYYN